MASGEYNTKVPVLLLSCRDEAGSKLIPTNNHKGGKGGKGGKGAKHHPAITTDAQLDAWITNHILPLIENKTDATVASLRRLYDPKIYPYPKIQTPYSIQLWMQSAIYSDRIDVGKGGSGRCSMVSTANNLLAGGSNVHASLFGHTARKGKYAHAPIASHGCEVSYVLGVRGQRKDPDELALTRTTASYWSNFAITGDPNAAGLPQWPAFNGRDEPTMMLNVDADGGVRLRKSQAQKEACEWWEHHKTNKKLGGKGGKGKGGKGGKGKGGKGSKGNYACHDGFWFNGSVKTKYPCGQGGKGKGKGGKGEGGKGKGSSDDACRACQAAQCLFQGKCVGGVDQGACSAHHGTWCTSGGGGGH
eukprot:COSAG01_NODE_2931_length_6832_cov_2.292737_1_plen_360_part_00